MAPLIILNWKMNLTLKEADKISGVLNNIKHTYQLLISPPIPFIAALSSSYPNLTFCAQNISVHNHYGSHTGEYSADMIKTCNVNYAIIGHSERRNNFWESNKIVRKKIENCINSKITPILCIGESLETRQNNNYKEFLIEQINDSLTELVKDVIIAYEPLWAIGSGITPTIEEIAEIFELIKTSGNLTKVANNARLVYGGSVNSANYQSILAIENSSGIMIGNAALDIEELKKILN